MLSLIFKQMLFFILMNNNYSDQEQINLIEKLLEIEKNIIAKKEFEMIQKLEF